MKDAISALLTALNNAPKAADTSRLTAAIEAANIVDVSNYTGQSVQVLLKAKQQAVELLNEDLTGRDQDRINQATQALLEAMDALEQLPAPTPVPDPDPAPPVQGEGTPTAGVKTDSPKTGDVTSLPIAAVGFTALGGFFGCRIKKV